MFQRNKYVNFHEYLQIKKLKIKYLIFKHIIVVKRHQLCIKKSKSLEESIEI